MAPVSLGEFIGGNRQELILRCSQRVEMMPDWPSTEAEVGRGIPIFLDQLIEELRHESSQTVGIHQNAVEHGHELFRKGLTVSQVVHDYGNVCQSVTDLAVELAIPISNDDFRTLNRCLDDAIAGAVSEYIHQERLRRNGQSEELRQWLDAAIAAFETIQAGTVGVTGATAALVHRSLLEIRTGLEASIPPLPGDQS